MSWSDDRTTSIEDSRRRCLIREGDQEADGTKTADGNLGLLELKTAGDRCQDCAELSRHSPNTETTTPRPSSSSRCTMLTERSMIRRGRVAMAEDSSSLEVIRTVSLVSSSGPSPAPATSDGLSARRPLLRRRLRPPRGAASIPDCPAMFAGGGNGKRGPRSGPGRAQQPRRILASRPNAA